MTGLPCDLDTIVQKLFYAQKTVLFVFQGGESPCPIGLRNMDETLRGDGEQPVFLLLDPFFEFVNQSVTCSRTQALIKEPEFLLYYDIVERVLLG